MLQAVLFDLWETLINDRPERAQPRRAWRNGAVLEVLHRHGCQPGVEAVQAALDASSAALARLHDQGKDLEAGGRARLFAGQLESLAGFEPSAAAIQDLEDVITSMPLDIAPLAAPHAAETVAAVKRRGLATALVCNAGFTTTPALLPMLEHYGLSQYLDVMVFSDQLGVAKPDPRIFGQALKGIDLPAGVCAFVGDNPHTDIHGAQSAGLFAIQVGAKERNGIRPDARIEDLSQLMDVLERLQS
jgi:HAD superfamily hydrolase (TIGR01509 family)